MFTTLIVKPIFNLLVIIYALLPGHNFGVALILFTVLVRLALWPLVKKQLHHAKAMRELQPELKRIKAATKGDRAKEQSMTMELYKEKGINPLATFPILIVQLIILIGLYSGLRKVVSDPESLVTFTYPFVAHLAWIRDLSHNISLFDHSLFGFIDLSKPAVKAGEPIYWPAMMLVIASAVAQYYQARQLLPEVDKKRGLRAILRDAGQGKQADQSEVTAAVSRSTTFLLPVMVLLFTINLASALSLYWLTGSIVAIIQQTIILRRDETELEAIADGKTKDIDAIPEGEVVEAQTEATIGHQAKTSTKNKKHRKKKRR